MKLALNSCKTFYGHIRKAKFEARFEGNIFSKANKQLNDNETFFKF